MSRDANADQSFAVSYDEHVVPQWSVRVASTLLGLVRSLELSDSTTALVAECRTGYLLKGLTDSLPTSARLMAVDPSSEMLDRARDRLRSDPRRIFYSSQSKNELSYANGVFHLVLCDSGLLTRSDLQLSGKELLRVLRPGGHLAVAFPLRNTFQAFTDFFREALYHLEMRDVEPALDNYLRALMTEDDIPSVLEKLELELVDHRVVQFDIPFDSGEQFLFSPFVEELFLPRWLTICQEDDQREPLFFEVVQGINTFFRGLSFHEPVSVACVLARRGS